MPQKVPIKTANKESGIKRLWLHRHVVPALIKEEYQSSYSQTRLRTIWGLLQAGLFAFTYSFFFGYLLNWQTGNLPFPVYVLSGLLGWSWISSSLSNSIFSLFSTQQTLQSFPFPRFLLPISRTLFRGTEALYHLFWLAIVMAYYRISPSWQLLYLPLVAGFTLLSALTPAVWILIGTRRNRDLLHALPVITQLGLWMTPVFFQIDIFPESLRPIIEANPWSSCVDMWRWAILGSGTAKWIWGIHTLILTSLLTLGIRRFERHETEYAES